MIQTLQCCIVLSVLALAACGQSVPSNVDSGIAEQILHIANQDEPKELDPQLSTGSPEHNIHLALYEGLTTRHPKTLRIEPGLAQSWQLSDDGLSYTFTLRKNARWSNGDVITAQDVAWSWQRSLMPQLASEWAYMKFYIVNAEKFYNRELSDFGAVGIHALDERTLKVTLNSPCDYFLQLLAHPSYFPVHPPTILTHGPIDQAVSRWARPENWVGNGPFTLKSWAVNKHVIVKKKPHYWDAKNIRLNGIHFYPITDQQTEVRAFKSGQIHLTYTPQLAIEKIAYYQKNQPEVLRITPSYSSYYYEFNTTKAPFDKALVRRAFALAIDRKSIVDNVTKAGEKPAYSLIPHDPEGYQPPALFHYNPELARQLLSQAGYPNGEGFPVIELLYNTLDSHRKVALAIQQMLMKNLNIHINLLNQEWKVYLANKRSLQHDMARAGWIADYLDPSNFTNILSSFSGNNNTGWKNEKYDQLIIDLQATADPLKRKHLYDAANQILAEEMPVIPLYQYSDVNLVAETVKGWYDNVMHYPPYNRVYLEAHQ